jgi:adenosine deaminase
MNRAISDWVRNLPKVDLHTHLDGSMRLSTVAELAKARADDPRLPDEADLEPMLTPPSRCSLEDYLASFDATVAVLQSKAALERAARELCEDAAAENVIYMEVRFAPLLHLENGLSPREVVESVLRGLAAGEEAHPLHTGLILCALRDEPSERSLEVAQLAAQFRNKGVVAFDLAGPEEEYPPYLHRSAIEFARDAGVHLTIHAGEGCCPEQIREAIDLGAERIGHGVYLFRDAGTERRVQKARIPLECCPTSNLQISGLMESYRDHPLKRYLDLGIAVTVNTDNRLMSRTSCTQELTHVVDAFDLSEDEVRRILSNGAQAAFAPEALRQTLTRTIEDAFVASSGSVS